MLWRTIAGVGLLVVGIHDPVWAKTGDINADSRTDQADLTLLTRFLNGDGLFSDTQTESADIDGDGVITSHDADILKQRLGLRVPESTGITPKIGLDSSNSGRVVDQQTGQPLVGVKIAVPDEDISVVTDQNGYFTLPRPIPPDQILTAKVGKYAPFSLTVKKDQGHFELKLEQLSARILVLDDGIHHLGDNKFAQSSANAGDFQRASEGIDLRRSFELDTLPDQDPYLKIGTLLGIDTPDSVQAGQSHLPMQKTFQSSAFRVYLNGTLIKRITLNGDNVSIPLPRRSLNIGRNEVQLVTAQASVSPLSSSGGLLGALFGMIVGTSDSDYDDIEIAHLLLVIPGREQRGNFRAAP